MAASSRADAAFEVYLELGTARSLVRLQEVLRTRMQRAPSLRTLESWSARFGWQARIFELERKARQQAEQEHLEWIRQHREHLRQEGLLLQQRGLDWLRNKDAQNVSAHEANRAIETGFKLEALALGEATERITLEESDERIERLSDDELEQLIRAAPAGDEGSAH